jgi:hypothetical protein
MMANLHKWLSAFGVVCTCLAFGSAAQAQQIKSIVIHVHTTGDDKDKEIEFTFYLVKGNTSFGKEGPLGHGQVWPNKDKRDIRITLTNPIPYGSRMEYLIRHDYANNTGNHGWEGRITADAEFVGGGTSPVLADTGDYKLGEKGNPKSREFKLNR